MPSVRVQPERTVEAAAAERVRWLAPVMLAVLAVLGFFVYPGHTFLESDSQIFMPVVLHRVNPALYSGDLMITGTHTAYTMWDELLLGVRRVTGWDFESILFLLQIGFRYLGMLGVLWLLESLLASRWLALLGAAVYELGAWVHGAALITVEYEPVPRAFALPFVLLGLALIARRHLMWAGMAGAVAFLLHPPTSLAFWAVFFISAILHTEDTARWNGLAWLPVAGFALEIFAWLEPLPVETQSFFTRIDPAWEKLQHLRASYVFASDWPAIVYALYACLAVVIGIAYARLRPAAETRLRMFLWMLPAIGVASVPLNWLLLEKLKWSLMPQLQPMRYILYLTLFGVVLGFAAGGERALRGCWAQASVWFFAALLVGFQPYALFLVTPLVIAVASVPRPVVAFAASVPVAVVIALLKPFGFAVWQSRNLRVFIVTLALTALILAVAAAGRRWPAAFPGAAAVACVVLLVAGSSIGRPASRNVRTPDMKQLSAFGLYGTPPNAVFLFPDAGRSLDPGVFRYMAQRDVYVDWKAGGQVNFFRSFADDWWQRWQATMADGYRPDKVREYRKRGIQYLVFRKLPADPPGAVVYQNATFAVVALK